MYRRFYSRDAFCPRPIISTRTRRAGCARARERESAREGEQGRALLAERLSAAHSLLPRLPVVASANRHCGTCPLIAAATTCCEPARIVACVGRAPPSLLCPPLLLPLPLPLLLPTTPPCTTRTCLFCHVFYRIVLPLLLLLLSLPLSWLQLWLRLQRHLRSGRTM
jgi:hypothetical protein